MAVEWVTLNGIKRCGETWKARHRWIGKRVKIWSREHQAWWRPGANGYTDKAEHAGAWDFVDAYKMTAHCGREKQIVYYAVTTLSSDHTTKP